MRKNLRRAFVIAGIVAALTTSCSFGGTERLGEAHFANSCKPAVQAGFEEGVLLLHSFEFKEAERSFRAVEVNDPTCSIAAWALHLQRRSDPAQMPHHRYLSMVGKGCNLGL